MRRAARLADRWNVSVEDEIWYCAPTLKQVKRVFWRRLKPAIPPHRRASKPNETELSLTLNSGHIIRCVGLNNYDDLRGSGLFFVLIAITAGEEIDSVIDHQMVSCWFSESHWQLMG